MWKDNECFMNCREQIGHVTDRGRVPCISKMFSMPGTHKSSAVPGVHCRASIASIVFSILVVALEYLYGTNELYKRYPRMCVMGMPSVAPI